MRTNPEAADTFSPLGPPSPRMPEPPPPLKHQSDSLPRGIVRDPLTGNLGTNIPVPTVEPVHDYDCGDYGGMFTREFIASALADARGAAMDAMQTISDLQARQAADMAAIKALDEAKASGTLPDALRESLRQHAQASERAGQWGGSPDTYATRRRHVQGHYEWQAEMQAKVSGK